jgi:hypothetical protein
MFINPQVKNIAESIDTARRRENSRLGRYIGRDDKVAPIERARTFGKLLPITPSSNAGGASTAAKYLGPAD